LRREIDWRSPLVAGGLILLILASFSQPAAAATGPAPVPGLTGSALYSPLPNITTGNAGSPETIFVFYNQHCGDCQRALTFLRDFSSRHPGVDIRYYDVFNSPENQTLFQRFNEQYNTTNSPVPAVFAGTKQLVGSESIERSLDGIVEGLDETLPASLPANSSSGIIGSRPTVFVFYNQYCGDCQRALSFLRNFSSRHPGVDIRYYDVSNSPENQTLFQRFNERYNTPNSPVPTVFAGTYVVTGSENIEKSLDGIVLGLEEEAVLPTPTNPLPGQPMVEITLPLVVTAALVDGINPCAFAVLIFLLVTLLGIKTRRKVLAAGIAYITAIFIFYFLSGLGLFAAVQVAGASWILQVAGAGVSIIAGLLMIADSIRPGTTPWLSIPSSGKGIIERVMRHATVPAAFVLGLVVGVFELPCTGGVYLAILSLLAGSMSISAGLPWLFVYNVIFILPLVVILLAIYFGLPLDRLEEWRRGRRNLLRFATGVMMLALGIMIIALMTR
jgi:cytochrome c biogenesis protein CcdA/glutaredoxin